MIASPPSAINLDLRLEIDERSIKDFVNFRNFALNPNHSQLYLGINSHIYLDPLTKFSDTMKQTFLERSFITYGERDREITSRAKIVYDVIIPQIPGNQKTGVLNQLLEQLKIAPKS